MWGLWEKRGDNNFKEFPPNPKEEKYIPPKKETKSSSLSLDNSTKETKTQHNVHHLKQARSPKEDSKEQLKVLKGIP